MTEQRFQVARRGLVVADTGLATFGLVFGVVAVAADRPWGSVITLLLLTAVHGSLAWLFARQGVVFTDDEIVATQGFRRHRVAWDDVERVHLDWAAEAAGQDREVLRIEQSWAGSLPGSCAHPCLLESTDGVGLGRSPDVFATPGLAMSLRWNQEPDRSTPRSTCRGCLARGS